ncbi:hypothetical protein CY34DRAFT_12498 [Suillus luteus UH-Slu-Lm8-n1]|uniref:HNH nuclease domain-containing protein n=1 Tax=Suillus luteus UH-Slu-Lm8-n1 TaxID=930992 RepID=A0A0D0BG36_9AGAM|nr:hypothetical protein CY34DRAFT_12498 [Suillus luteus UH-Slu-Lm8-n1]
MPMVWSLELNLRESKNLERFEKPSRHGAAFEKADVSLCCVCFQISNDVFDDDIPSVGIITLLDDYAFKGDLLTMMSDTGPETTNELKRRANAILLEMGSTSDKLSKQRLFFNHQVAVLAQMIVLQRTATTIDIITKLPENIIDDLASIIDNPENGMILDVIMHDPFDSYKWCLLPIDVLHKYTVHWFRHVPAGLGNFTEVQFEDHSQTGIQLPNPTFIALHAAVAHVSHFNPLGG